MMAQRRQSFAGQKPETIMPATAGIIVSGDSFIASAFLQHLLFYKLSV